MRKSVFFLTILLLNSFSATAQTTISGDISGQIFKPSGNPYVVKENLFIGNNKKTVIKDGCVFLFMPFTGVVVYGGLEVEGLPGNPVVFTSVNDSSFNEISSQSPEPFDWNGIIIEKSAESVKMSNFHISYSVFGIKAKNESIILSQGLFRQNGQFNFTLHDKIIDVVSNVPFDYNIAENLAKSHRNNSNGWVKPVGISSIVVGTGFLGTMGYFIFHAYDQDKKYDNTKQKDDIHSYISEIDKAVKYSMITGIIGGALVSVGTGLLVWEHTTKNDAVVVYPVFGKTNGFQLVIDF
ncbi:MAG: hypothetical protein JXB49_32135 [Bacteroidales bacterium]|nr:hypothetical protein [Bacteroidales bacterium]